VAVQPPKIMIAPQLQFPTTRDMRLRFMWSDPVRILKGESTSPLVTWEVTTPPEGQRLGNIGYHSLRVTLPPGKDFQAGGYVLSLFTDAKDPAYQRIDVPITNTPAPPPLGMTPTTQPGQPRAIRDGLTPIPPPPAPTNGPAAPPPPVVN
jgi:hypothetical protein